MGPGIGHQTILVGEGRESNSFEERAGDYELPQDQTLFVYGNPGLLAGFGMEALEIAVVKAQVLPVAFDQQDPGL